MRLFLAAAGVSLGFLAIGPALAEPLPGPEISARAAGGEFRGDTNTLRGFESHIWRFAPDGRVSAVAVARRAPGNFTSQIEFGDTGMWRVEGDRLCVQWSGVNRQFDGCYTVDGQGGSHVRLVGPARWEGTLGR